MDTAREKNGRGTVVIAGATARAEAKTEPNRQRAAFGHERSRPQDVMENTMAVVDFLGEVVATMHNGRYGVEMTPSGAMGLSLILDEVKRNLGLARRELAERENEGYPRQ